MVTPVGFQHYDCTGCGDCCRGRFAILITEDDKKRIEEQGWTSEELELKGQPLFRKRGSEYQLAHRRDGACVFLQDDNLCRIHAKYGEPAKPLACRLYPFRYVPLGSQVRVDVRFDCPATASNKGRPISEYAKDLQPLIKVALPEKAADIDTPSLYGDLHLSWAQYCRITEAYERVLTDVSLSLVRRITACIKLTELLRQPDLINPNAKRFNEIIDTMAAEVQEDAIDDELERSLPNNVIMAAFRQIIGVYGRIDQVGEKAQVFKRFTSSVNMLFGKGTVPKFRDDFPNVTFSQVDDLAGELSGTAALIAERYLHTHLTSMGFFGLPFYNRSYTDGMSALLLTYPLICWYAKLYAIGEGLTAPDATCVEKAIMIVDHQHGITPLLDMPSERMRMNMLCEHETLRAIVTWYGF